MNHQTENNDYFVSMTDMMVGVLFVFIIIVSYFVLQLQKNIEEQETYPVKVEETKQQLVTALADALRAAGIEVTEDPIMGVVSLKGDGLFNRGSSELAEREGAVDKVRVLAQTLKNTFSCYSFYNQNGEAIPLQDWRACNEDSIFIESIYVEGHSDSDPFRGVLPDGSRNNLQLSARRATNTYEQMVIFEPELTSFMSPNNQQALSVAAYGEQRPVATNDTLEGKSQNRRIAIRLVMYMPSTKDSLDAFIARLSGFE